MDVLLLLVGALPGLALGALAATVFAKVRARRVAAEPAAQAVAGAPAVTDRPAEPVSLPVSASAAGTPVGQSLPTATAVDHALVALPTATAAEQRAGSLVPEIEQRPTMVERPIVIKPDPPKPLSRFAPDPSRFAQRALSAYANAPAPVPGTAGRVREPQITGTVVNTISVRIPSDVSDAATVRPPIRHILPRPLTRDSYEKRARELERAAQERLAREQQRLAVSIREQLAHDKRHLEMVLDNRLDDTVLLRRPRVLVEQAQFRRD